MRLREGRFFDARDAWTAPRPMLVNEAFARAYFQDGRPALGRQLPGAFAADEQTVSEIVEVVGDVRKDGLDGKPQPAI